MSPLAWTLVFGGGCFFAAAVVAIACCRAAAREGLFLDHVEKGRRLASRREDLIAQGVAPADLAIPLLPGDGAP